MYWEEGASRQEIQAQVGHLLSNDSFLDDYVSSGDHLVCVFLAIPSHPHAEHDPYLQHYHVCRYSHPAFLTLICGYFYTDKGSIYRGLLTLHGKYSWFCMGNNKMMYFWNPPSMSAFGVVTTAVSSIHYYKR